MMGIYLEGELLSIIPHLPKVPNDAIVLKLILQSVLRCCLN